MSEAVGRTSWLGNLDRSRSYIAPGTIVYDTPLVNRNSQTASTTDGFFSFSVGTGTVPPRGDKLPFLQASPPESENHSIR